jgi:hypothetical protein
VVSDGVWRADDRAALVGSRRSSGQSETINGIN